MQRGFTVLTRRSVLPQPLSPTCMWRAEGKSGKKRTKAWHKYKGPLKGKMEVLFTANNKWKYHWYRKLEDVPESIKRLEIDTPYDNAFLNYDPNDPAEIRAYLGKLRASQIREQNEESIDTKGVKLKEWLPDQRVVDDEDQYNNDEDDNEGDQMEEEYDPDEEDVEWMETVEKKEKKLERQKERKLRKERLAGASHKRILEFEKLSDPEKLEKLIAVRKELRTYVLKQDALREKTMAMTPEEVLAKLQSDFGYTEEKIEDLLRKEERGVSPARRDALDKRFKLGKYYEEGKPSGLDAFLLEKGHANLIGYRERLFGDEPPKIPPPKDVTKLRFYQKMLEAEAARKKAEEAAAAAAAAAAAKPAVVAAPAPAKGKKGK